MQCTSEVMHRMAASKKAVNDATKLMSRVEPPQIIAPAPELLEICLLLQVPVGKVDMQNLCLLAHNPQISVISCAVPAASEPAPRALGDKLL